MGLDRETAKHAFSQFVSSTNATASQLEFIDLIVDELTENGVMSVARLYEQPYVNISPLGPESVFPAAKVNDMVNLLDSIRQRAVA